MSVSLIITLFLIVFYFRRSRTELMSFTSDLHSLGLTHADDFLDVYKAINNKTEWEHLLVLEYGPDV